MIDFHTHILPGIDDGSRNIEMTKEMLLMEKSMGTDLIIATPHFYAHRTRVDEFLKKRDRSYAEVKALLESDPDLPKVRVGAEVYYFNGMGRAEHIKELTIEGTDMILLELPFRPWDRQVIDDIWEIKTRQHLTVILAHVERYKELQKDRKLYEEALDAADIIQLNAGSFDGGFMKKRLMMNLLKSGRKVIIGSDCHNTTSRKPNLNMGYDIITKKLGSGRSSEIQEDMEELFG